MGIDIHGKWQRRIGGDWQDIEGYFEWLRGNRNRDFFETLNDFRNDATDDIERELMYVLAEEYNNISLRNKNIQELNDEGYNLWGAGYLCLKELKELRKTLKDNQSEAGALDSFINEVNKYVKEDDDEEGYRVIFVFDN